VITSVFIEVFSNPFKGCYNIAELVVNYAILDWEGEHISVSPVGYIRHGALQRGVGYERHRSPS
jgi:hypothetical protein